LTAYLDFPRVTLPEPVRKKAHRHLMANRLAGFINEEAA
jgi:hypothetical protein